MSFVCNVCRLSLATFVSLAPVVGGRPARGDEPLAARIEAIIDAPEFKHAHWGLLAVDQADGKVLYERNADKLFAPASTTKLFSTAAALVEFGPDHRFLTPVVLKGALDAGDLRGDLILVASGDLTLGGRTDPEGRIAFVDSDHTYANFSDASQLTSPDPLAGLDDLARQVAAAGIRNVRGNVLIDDRLFEHAESTGSGPARLTPILVNDNVIDFTVSPAAMGEPAKVAWRPQTATYAVDAQVQTAAAGSPAQISIEMAGPGRLVVRGQIGADRAPLVAVHEVADPASFARGLFIEALERAGVRVEASELAGNDARALPPREETAGLRRVACLMSPRFADNARLILKVSHNLHASTLPLLLAAKQGQRTLAEGLRRQHDVLKSLGVGIDTISFGGAAGGDRADYVTPRATVELLQAMRGRPEFEAYREALPILGQDGTLAKSVAAESPARGRVQAKTGTLLFSNTMNGRWILTSKALGGYCTASSGRQITFAAFVNHVDLATGADRDRIGRVLGAICEALHAGL